MAGERVLVIDDQKDNIEFVVDYILKPNGYKALTAKDGAEGLHKALTEDPDLVLESVGGRSRLWERLSKATADMIVVSESLVPEPASESIDLFRQLPDSPAVVLISEAEENPEQQAAFLAAGCDAVLYAGLAPGRLHEVIQTILEKRTQTAQEKFAAQPALTC